MGNAFYRIKTGLYVFVIALVGVLFTVRAYNAVQKSVYLSPTIFDNGDVQVSLSYPARILSPKNEASYPLTVSFVRLRNSSPSQTYEIVLESPTLLFVDAKGVAITPHFQFASDSAFIEQNIYVRPFQSENYPSSHPIFIKVLVDGQEYQPQPAAIEIKTEPQWFSYLSLIAASLLEISIASVLVTWIVTALDTTWNARKELRDQRRTDLRNLISQPLLERMRRFGEVEEKIAGEHLGNDLHEDLESVRQLFSERKFWQAVGEQLRQEEQHEKLEDIQKLYDCLPEKKHPDSISALAQMLDLSHMEQDVVPLISALVKLWDDFDADAKELIVGALKIFSQEKDVALSEIPAADLSATVFSNLNHRRLLRDTEVQKIFPQLLAGPLGYQAAWLTWPNPRDNPKVLDWLKQHTLIANPFGWEDLKNYPFYPEGFARPDQWEDFQQPVSWLAHCPTAEDGRVLAFLLRSECLPAKKRDAQGNEVVYSGKQIFPVRVSSEQTAPAELPLINLARSAARTWTDILPFSPDAMLDLLPAEQDALLELLCWTFGSNMVVINLVKRAGLLDNETGKLLRRKIEEFKTEFSSAYLPPDSVLVSWLKIRPPDLNYTYLILPLDEFPAAAHSWWLEQFSLLVHTLFHNGIITKAFASSPLPVSFSLPVIQLNWSDAQLKKSLNSQFDVAMDKETQNEMGSAIDFRALFGFRPDVGYFETEEQTTDKLISASHNSLARTLTLGNRLLQYHCDKRGISEKYLYVKDLEAILKTA